MQKEQVKFDFGVFFIFFLSLSCTYLYFIFFAFVLPLQNNHWKLMIKLQSPLACPLNRDPPNVMHDLNPLFLLLNLIFIPIQNQLYIKSAQKIGLSLSILSRFLFAFPLLLTPTMASATTYRAWWQFSTDHHHHHHANLCYHIKKPNWFY